FTYVRWLTRRVDEVRQDTVTVNDTPAGIESAIQPSKSASVDTLAIEDIKGETPMLPPSKQPVIGAIDRALTSNSITSYLVKDYHAEALKKDANLRRAYEQASVYPAEVEYLFSHLLIVTACFKSFAHGASDVGNAVGPFAGILEVLAKGTIDDNRSAFPLWASALGASAMLVGIISYGWKTLVTLGVKITKISPTKGLAIDLASAIVIIVTAYLKIPVSSTQTQVGAILGASLLSGKKGPLSNTNWAMVVFIVVIWIANLGVSIALSAGWFSLLGRSPKI
ncbi:hypothetical protein HDV05_002398, partial [Chytridiales sp. JEL 0842]